MRGPGRASESGQADDGAVVEEVDPVGGRGRRQARHRHHVAADQNHEARPGGEPDLAKGVLDLLEEADGSTFAFTYPDDVPLKEKAETLAHRLYGASSVTWDGRAKRRLDRLEADGYGDLPVCVAKTQYSFSTDATLRGAPSGHDLHVREVRLSAGAGFVVLVCGDVMTMPGLPAIPAAARIDLLDDGTIVGLS